MTLGFSLPELTSVYYSGVFVDTQTVAMAEIVLKHTTEYLPIGKDDLASSMLEAFDGLTLENM